MPFSLVPTTMQLFVVRHPGHDYILACTPTITLTLAELDSKQETPNRARAEPFQSIYVWRPIFATGREYSVGDEWASQIEKMHSG